MIINCIETASLERGLVYHASSFEVRSCTKDSAQFFHCSNQPTNARRRYQRPRYSKTLRRSAETCGKAVTASRDFSLIQWDNALDLIAVPPREIRERTRRERRCPACARFLIVILKRPLRRLGAAVEHLAVDVDQQCNTTIDRRYLTSIQPWRSYKGET